MIALIAGLDLVSLIGWVLIVAAGLAWEIKALVDPKRGDTLSEAVWRGLRVNVVLRWLAAGLLGWLLVHFVFLGRFG